MCVEGGPWINPLSPVNVASVFLDNAARLARAHRASSARTTRCSYIRRPSYSRRLKLVLMWTKIGVHVPPSIPPKPLPSAPHLFPCPDPFTATGSTPKSPLYKVSVALADRGPRGRHHISFMFLRLTGQLFIEPEKIYNWRRAAVLGGKQVKPRPSRGISSLVWSEFSPGVSAAVTGQACQSSAGRSSEDAHQTSLPYCRGAHMVTKSPDSRVEEWLWANQMPEVPVKESKLLVNYIY